MGEKGNILDSAGLTGVGSGLMSGTDIAGSAGDSTGGHHEGGVTGVVKAAAHHLKTITDSGVQKHGDLGGVMPTPLEEKPPASQ